MHGAEVNVVEAAIVAVVAKAQRPGHADRPVLDVEGTDIGPIQVVGQHPGDVGVDIDDGHHHVRRVAVGHHKSQASGKTASRWSRYRRWAGDFSRHGFTSSPHWSSCSTRRSYS